jgi:hypothetical protein
MTRIYENHSGVNVWGWNVANQGNRVHANIHVTIPVIRPNHPHQGSACKDDGLILICLYNLTPLKIRGTVKKRMKMAYPAKTFHENGA